jgi:F0F1-type ATP synthase assembly protein I
MKAEYIMKKARWMGRPLQELAIAGGSALLAPVILGWLLDGLLGRAPLMLFVGSSIGVLAGTIVVVRITVRRIEALSQPTASAGSHEAVSFGEEDRA